MTLGGGEVHVMHKYPCVRREAYPKQHYDVESNFDLEQLGYRATILLPPEIQRAPSEGLC